MACKNALKIKNINNMADNVQPATTEKKVVSKIDRLLFGVDSRIPADDLLQNNINEFEWVVRNKLYPNFWGRNIVGENCLTKKEIDFLHDKGCKIDAIYSDAGEKKTAEQGKLIAKKVIVTAFELEIPEDTAIFFEIGEKEEFTTDCMRGFAEVLISEGYVSGFKVNTDAKYDFDREYSRGMQTDREIFSKCLIWTVSPSLSEYERVTTTHLIHPDNWIPFAPSGITRNDIAIWQYGKDCHPIHDDKGMETTFNVDLMRRADIIIDNMF